MNTTTESEVTALQTIDVSDSGRASAGNLILDIPTMQSLMRVADLMASGKSTVPAHLQKNPADCMAVCMQAMQWGMNPFAVAQKTHLVGGTLGYEAQLVNAVIQGSNSIEGRFFYEYRGTSPKMECRVGAVIKGEKDITWNEFLNESNVTTKNSPLWKTNPKQQLSYLQVKNWARLYCPGAILGVYTPDEFDAPQPRNMGAAQVLQTVEPDAGILESAQNAAQEGVAVYNEFWKKAGYETRKAIGAERHQGFKDIAVAADKARTVNNVKTFEEVMTMIVSSKTIDQLFVAGDWINSITNPEEQELLNGKFDEIKSTLGAA